GRIALPASIPLLLLPAAAALLAVPLGAQVSVTMKPTRVNPPCQSRVAIEFIAPMPTEEVPNLMGPTPNPESWTIVLELAAEQNGPPITRVREGTYIPSPGAAALPPTDLNGDAILGDPHPAIPKLTL